MKSGLGVFVAIPIILIVAISAAMYLNQPKVNNAADANYLDVNGDEYLAQDYVTPEEQAIGGSPDTILPKDYFVPVKVTDCEQKPEGELRDSCYILYSSITNDPAGCLSINDPTAKDDCYTRAAAVNENPELCKQVELGRSECFSDIAVNTGNSTLCEQTDYERKQCYAAVLARDGTMCAPSEDMSACVYAVFDNNSEECLGVQEYKQFCYHSVAIDTNNASLCANAGDAKDSCVFRVALNTNNAAMCEQLTETRDNCVAWVAFNTNNKALCEKAGAEKQSCLDDLS